jgi:hypothetical protein
MQFFLISILYLAILIRVYYLYSKLVNINKKQNNVIFNYFKKKS